MNQPKFLELENMEGIFILININNISHIIPRYFKIEEENDEIEYTRIYMTNGSELDMADYMEYIKKLINNQ
jgi:hypothetical protein